MRQHTGKSLSFLMELLMVIFFFTIAASICVLIMSNTKEKDQYAKSVKETLFYGQSLIAQESSFLNKDHFYMDETGTAKQEEDIYEVQIQVLEQGTQGDLCCMKITKGEKELAVLNFYRRGEAQ